MKIFVLDTYAILAFYGDEPGADYVRELIFRSSSGEISLLMSVINLGEVWYTFNRRTSEVEADHIIDEIRGLNIKINNPDWKQTRQAAIYKTKGSISYADCFAASLAKLNSANLVTGDKEFLKFQNEITIKWLE